MDANLRANNSMNSFNGYAAMGGMGGMGGMNGMGGLGGAMGGMGNPALAMLMANNTSDETKRLLKAKYKQKFLDREKKLVCELEKREKEADLEVQRVRRELADSKARIEVLERENRALKRQGDDLLLPDDEYVPETKKARSTISNPGFWYAMRLSYHTRACTFTQHID